MPLANCFLLEFHSTLLLTLKSLKVTELFKLSKLVIKLIVPCWKLLIFLDMIIVKSENKMSQILFKSFPFLQKLKLWVQSLIIRVNSMFSLKELLTILLKIVPFILIPTVLLNLSPKHSKILSSESSNNLLMVPLELFWSLTKLEINLLILHQKKKLKKA